MMCLTDPVQYRRNNSREVCFWMTASTSCQPMLRGGIRFYNIEGENTGRYIGMKEGNASGMNSVPVLVPDVGMLAKRAGGVHRSNRALRYFPPAVGGIRLNPVGSAVRLVHWLLDKLLGPDSAAIPRIPAQWSMALDHGSCRAAPRPRRAGSYMLDPIGWARSNRCRAYIFQPTIASSQALYRLIIYLIATIQQCFTESYR